MVPSSSTNPVELAREEHWVDTVDDRSSVTDFAFGSVVPPDSCSSKPLALSLGDRGGLSNVVRTLATSA
jgi:hypothetical protein